MTPFDPRLPIIAAEARVKTCHVYHCWQAMREMGQAFHVSAFAQFAGLTEAHVNAILAALEAHKALPGPKRASIERGTRLPLDWRLPDDWKAYAIEQRKWEPDVVDKVAASFAAHWQAKSGKDATKLDWKLTWQNWVRNSYIPDGEYVPAEGRQRTPSEWRDFCKERVDKAAAMGWTQGLEEWTLKLREAEAKLSSNVVPLNREMRSA